MDRTMILSLGESAGVMVNHPNGEVWIDDPILAFSRCVEAEAEYEKAAKTEGGAKTMQWLAGRYREALSLRVVPVEGQKIELNDTAVWRVVRALTIWVGEQGKDSAPTPMHGHEQAS